jgi:FkbM family methyltransferase
VMRVVKDTVRDLLAQCGYVLVRSSNSQLSGFNFARDVRLLVKSEAPVCFDVGANLGQTINLVQRAFRDPRIYAFEPSTESFSKLEQERFGPRVSLFNLALGERNSQQEFTNYENSELSSFLALDEHPENRFRGIKVRTKELVQIRTIDWFVEQNQIDKIDLLKIDTQGYDLNVLRGASGSFQRGLVETVFVELNFIRMYEHQSDAYLISTFLANYGMHLADYYEKNYQNQTLAWCTGLFARR